MPRYIIQKQNYALLGHEAGFKRTNSAVSRKQGSNPARTAWTVQRKTATKICEACHRTYRPSKNEDRGQWKRRKYCCLKCVGVKLRSSSKTTWYAYARLLGFESEKAMFEKLYPEKGSTWLAHKIGVTQITIRRRMKVCGVPVVKPGGGKFWKRKAE